MDRHNTFCVGSNSYSFDNMKGNQVAKKKVSAQDQSLVPDGVNPFQEGYDAGYQQAHQEKLYAPLRDMNHWKDIVLEQLVVAGIFRREHEGSPRLAIDELVDYHIGLALDPKVSHQAEDLYEKGRTDQRNMDFLFIILSSVIGAVVACLWFGLPT
jgi:hypothetical protein